MLVTETTISSRQKDVMSKNGGFCLPLLRPSATETMKTASFPFQPDLVICPQSNR